MIKMLFTAMTLAILLAAPYAMAGPALVKTITKGGVNIKYFRENDVGRAGFSMAHVCLTNTTATTKKMVWTKVTPPSPHLLDIIAAPNSRECAGIPIHHRIEWNFVDGNTVRTGEAMSLGGFGKDVVNFEWRSTRAEMVQACQKQKCDVIVSAGVNNADDMELSSQYGLVTLMCLAMCEAQY